MKKKNKEIKLLYGVLLVIFTIFLILPVFQLLLKSFLGKGGLTLASYRSVFLSRGFGRALGNSFLVAAVSALVTTVLAFFLAYTINYTNIPSWM